MRLNGHESACEDDNTEFSKGLECVPLPSPTISISVRLSAISVYIAPQFSKYRFDCLRSQSLQVAPDHGQPGFEYV